MEEARNKTVEVCLKDSLKFGSLTRREYLEVHSGVDKEGQRTERADGAISENRWWKSERPPFCLQCEGNRPCASASSREILIGLRALDSTKSRRDRCDAGTPAHSGEQYSIEPQTKAL